MGPGGERGRARRGLKESSWRVAAAQSHQGAPETVPVSSQSCPDRGKETVALTVRLKSSELEAIN